MRQDAWTVIALTFAFLLTVPAHCPLAATRPDAVADRPEQADDKQQEAVAKYPASNRLRNPSNGHEYQRIDVPMSWHEAKSLCEELGGHLATATSADENNFIYTGFARDHVCWLGGSDEREEGSWQWVTGEPFDFANWFGREPNNSSGVEHYLAVGNTQSISVKGQSYFYRFGLKWNDHVKNGTYHGVPIVFPVCEWDSSPPDQADRLRTMPDGGVEELARFLKDVQGIRPDTSPESDQWTWRTPQCMTLAAEKILELEKAESSTTYLMALRILLEGRVSSAAFSTPLQQRQAIDFVKMFLQAKIEAEKFELADVHFALWSARVMENADSTDLAIEAYESFAKIVAEYGNQKFAEIGDLMQSAACRLKND